MSKKMMGEVFESNYGFGNIEWVFEKRRDRSSAHPKIGR